MSERIAKPRWLKVLSNRNSECGSANLFTLDFDQWWTDGSPESLWGDRYIKVPRHADETVHRVHCRHTETPRLGMRDGMLYWIVDAPVGPNRGGANG